VPGQHKINFLLFACFAHWVVSRRGTGGCRLRIAISALVQVVALWQTFPVRSERKLDCGLQN
jgi:hypothetical protein